MQMKKLLETISKLEECPPAEGPMPASNPGNPVTMSVTLNASGTEHVQDLINMMKNAGLGAAQEVTPQMMPMRQDMDRLRAIVGQPEMEADEAYSDVITDDEDLEEGMDPKALMGQIRKMAKGVETSKDEREHQMFASQVESDLIDLFQYYNQVQRDTDKQEIVRNLIRQNKKAQQQPDLRNANNIVSVLWDLMNANEAYANEPEPEYQDHKYMTKDLAGGINREKGAYAASQRGDNAMAVETIKKQLYKALAEKKAKPDFLDMDKDGNKKEPMKKAIADKKKKGPVKEVSSKTRQAYNKAAQADLDKAQASGDKKTFKKRDRGLDLSYDANIRDMKKSRLAKTQEAEFKAPTHELDDTARKAMNIAQMIKRKINSGEKMDDMDYNQMAELGHVLSRFGTNFGPQSMKDVFNHMKQYTDDRNEYGTGYPEFNVERFKELIAMAK